MNNGNKPTGPGTAVNLPDRLAEERPRSVQGGVALVAAATAHGLQEASWNLPQHFPCLDDQFLQVLKGQSERKSHRGGQIIPIIAENTYTHDQTHTHSKTMNQGNHAERQVLVWQELAQQ